MMKYKIIKEYKEEQFQRITGVKRVVFERKKSKAKHRRSIVGSSRIPAGISDAHIAASYGIAESNMYQNIKRIEETLIKD